MNSLQATSLQPSSRIPLAAHACTYDDSAAHMQSSVLSQLQLSYIQFCNIWETYEIMNKLTNIEREETSLHLLIDKHQDWLQCDREQKLLKALTAGHTSAGHISLWKGFMCHIRCYNMFIKYYIITSAALTGCKRSNVSVTWIDRTFVKCIFFHTIFNAQTAGILKASLDIRAAGSSFPGVGEIYCCSFS